MRKILLALSAVAATLAPVGSGALPVISSDNVTFLANIPDVPAIGGKIVGDYMYVSTLQGLRIYNVSVGIPVLVGAFELPHWQNEGIDTNGQIALISADHVLGDLNVLYVLDVSIPHAPHLKGAIVLDGSGHTSSCIQNCKYAWSRGGDVIDLTNPANPRRVATGPYDAHDTNVDAQGLAWVGSGGVYDTNVGRYGPGNLGSPPWIAGGSFGWHNSLRPNAELSNPTLMADSKIDPGELVIGSDEDWLLNSCAEEGAFKTSWFRIVNGRYTIQPLDTHRIGAGNLLDGRKPGRVTATCSAHWFDFHKNVVAIGWYEQGVRFLDVSNPSNIRNLGWWMPGETAAWGAEFHEVKTGPTAGVYVYSFDAVRGIDVLRFTGAAGGASVSEPPLQPMPASLVTRPHPEFGWACRIIEPAA